MRLCKHEIFEIDLGILFFICVKMFSPYLPWRLYKTNCLFRYFSV